MKTTRQFLLVSAASVLLGVSACVQTPGRVGVQNAADAGTNAAAQKIKCAGTVTDAAGHPLAGATVEYWRYETKPFLANPLELKGRITTKATGAFEFQVSRAAGFLLARKPGLAPAWIQLGQQFNSVSDKEEHLALTPTAALAGVVVDETDKPVAHAGVCVAMAVREVSPDGEGRGFNYLSGRPARDCFAARTDAAGHFRIKDFPANATATLAVQAPGKTLRQTEQNFAGWNSLPWHGGQEDIKLVVEPAGSIEGKIIVAGSNQPPPAARLTLQPNALRFSGFDEREPVQSGADGAFHISDVAAGSYGIHAVFGTNAVQEWVADTVPVSVEAGQITRGIQVTAGRGGLLEVAVLGEKDRKPLAQVMVNAYRQNFQSAARSDSNGIVLLRLPPGDYQLMVSRDSMAVSRNQNSASVEAGKTNRVEIEIAAPRMVSGIVRQPDGQPAAGLRVRIVGGFGPGAGDVKTDAGGKFELEWNQRGFGQNDTTDCVLVRDADHNLAVAQDIDEDTGPLDLKLAPGLTLAGRAECDGKPVTNATVSLIFHTGRRGMFLPGWSRSTDTPGRFEITAIPPGRKYGVSVTAPGYGQKSINDVDAPAEAGRMELDPFDLKLANLKLAGQVLDADDKPVVGVNVNLNGEGQPNGNTTTDSKGRFHFQVCEGQVRLFANSQTGGFAQTTAEAGDTNVVLQLGQTYNNAPGAAAHKLKGTVTDASGKPVVGAQVAVFPVYQFNGSRWTKTATNGAFNLTWSLQPWQMQSGGALLVARDPARNLAVTEELPEDATNLDVKLKPALTVAGVVRSADDSPLAGAQVGVWLKAGNNYDQLDEQMAAADAQGRYEIKCLPPDAHYIVYASAKGHGQRQQQVEGDSETNREELSPFVLKLADRVLAGQVLNENDKPVAGAYVNLSGEDQPNGNMATDSKGRFHFQVCEGQVRLFANSPQGGAFAQATAEAGETNVVMTLGSQPGNIRQTPHRAPLKGSPLPDLAGVNLAGDAAPASQPVLLCLFDAGQRSSRHVVHQLDEQAAALRQQGVTVLGVQAAVTSDEILNQWKSASPVSFPLGRVTEKSEKSKWALAVPALPWLILADANHRVVMEGFALDELDAQVKKLAK
jgi:protocatechuate 3,4-dioxygenase beta subunit